MTDQDIDDMINEDAEILAEMAAAADDEAWGLYDEDDELDGEHDAGREGAVMADRDERVTDEDMDADAEDGGDAGDDEGDDGDNDGDSNSGGNSTSGKSSDRVAMWEVQVGWRGAADVQMGEAKQRTTNGTAGEVVGSGPGKRRRDTTFAQWDVLPWKQMCVALAGGRLRM